MTRMKLQALFDSMSVVAQMRASDEGEEANGRLRKRFFSVSVIMARKLHDTMSELGLRQAARAIGSSTAGCQGSIGLYCQSDRAGSLQSIECDGHRQSIA